MQSSAPNIMLTSKPLIIHVLTKMVPEKTWLEDPVLGLQINSLQWELRCGMMKLVPTTTTILDFPMPLAILPKSFGKTATPLALALLTLMDSLLELGFTIHLVTTSANFLRTYYLLNNFLFANLRVYIIYHLITSS